MKRLLPLILILLLLLSACGREEPEQTIQCPAEPEQTAAPSEATSVSTVGGTEGPEGVLEEKDTETVYLLTRMSALDDSGSESWHKEYEYNEAGLLAEALEYASTGDLILRSVYTYNEDGLCVRVEHNAMDPEDPAAVASVQTTSYSYNDLGQVVLQQDHENGTLVTYSEYTYDEHGNYLTHKVYFGGELAYDCSYQYTYDHRGNLLTREEYMDGALCFRLECTYDGQDRCTENATYNFEGSLDNRCEFVWEGSTQTSSHYDMEDNLYMTTVTTYDDHGNITFQEHQYPDGTVVASEYIYEPFEIKK